MELRIYIRSDTSWTQQQKLVASDTAQQAWFGKSVAISEDYALVGAFQGGPAIDGSDTSDMAGAAYMFARSDTSWTHQQKLLAPIPAAQDSFGNSVAVNGVLALVGSYGYISLNGHNAGAVYVFERADTNWTLQRRLGFDIRGGIFGSTSALVDDSALVGDYSFGSGVAHMFGLVPPTTAPTNSPTLAPTPGAQPYITIKIITPGKLEMGGSVEVYDRSGNQIGIFPATIQQMNLDSDSKSQYLLRAELDNAPSTVIYTIGRTNHHCCGWDCSDVKLSCATFVPQYAPDTCSLHPSRQGIRMSVIFRTGAPCPGIFSKWVECEPTC